MESFPLFGTLEDRRRWADEFFRGWKVAAFDLFTPLRGRRHDVVGLVVARSPCMVSFLGKIMRSIDGDTVEVSIAQPKLSWMVGNTEWDGKGFRWWMTEMWLRSPRMSCRYDLKGVRLMALQRGILHEPETLRRTAPPGDAEE